ncbi:hypothetical protein CQW23_35143 [Capsicum baccatum]|uniref:Secreted protein n=1 Tax=Capsicum baccatum TaxID=33114 RepID=A0A2G2UWW1_CAPBA|nr:hypothetical protein CQW23_35143 [Capsicum baccatum]
MVPWCLSALVPRCLGALLSWCPGALVPWCHGATPPWCHGATPPWCYGGLAPLCLGAMVPWCPGATVPSCPGALVPCAWSLPREQHPVLVARTKAPSRPMSSASSPVVDDATDNRHERTMKRDRRCYTGTDSSHGLAMQAAMRPRCTPTWPLSAYDNYRQSP